MEYEKPYYALWDKQSERRMYTGLNCRTKEDVRKELIDYLQPDVEEIYLTDNPKLQLMLEVCEFILEESEIPFIID